MRTITEIITTTIYNYNELSYDAKENVKRKYLEEKDNYDFEDMCMEYLKASFPNSELHIEYSLCYVQGDYFHIYGCFSFKDLIENINFFTEVEKKILDSIIKNSEITNVKIYKNNYYNNYYGNFTDDIIPENSVEEKIVEQFEAECQELYENLCTNFKKAGYDFFYEVDEEELIDWIDVNNFEFLEDGSIFRK